VPICNETELTIELKNGSIIALKGAEDPDNLRGVGLNFVILDEYADMDPSVWGEVIRPMLATTNGKALFIGTPKGYDHFYDMYMAAQTMPAQWGQYHFTTLQGGYVPAEEVALAKFDPTITPREFAQEWEASFENLTGKVYDGFSRLIGTGNVGTYLYKGGPILCGMDFNVDPMTVSFAQKVGKQIHFFDEISIRNSNTYEMCDAIKAKFPGKEREITIYPDPAGNSRSTKAPVGVTDYTILRKARFKVYNPGRPYGLVDRINTVNGMLKNAAGERHIFFDPLNCKLTIKAFDGLCFKESTRIPDKKSGLDHYTDNAGYLVMGVAPMKFGRRSSTQEFRP
jgi:hypothetical protein